MPAAWPSAQTGSGAWRGRSVREWCAPRSSTARPCASARNRQLPSPGTRSTPKLGTAAAASAASAAQYSDDARALLALHAARGARCGGRLLRAGVCRCCAVRAEAVRADSEGSMPAQLACQVRKVPAHEVTLFAGRRQGSTCERGSQGRPPARQACWPRVDVHHLCCCVGHPAASQVKSSKAINDGFNTHKLELQRAAIPLQRCALATNSLVCSSTCEVCDSVYQRYTHSQCLGLDFAPGVRHHQGFATDP